MSSLMETPEYRAWTAMKGRCQSPTHQAFRYYGARGISVCLQWKESFAAFLAYMGRRPSSLHTLDRINNDGNYEPGNCRWATRAEQMRNTRRNILLTHDGLTLCVEDWAKKLGILPATLTRRIRRHGVEKALSTPRLKLGQRILYAGN